MPELGKHVVSPIVLLYAHGHLPGQTDCYRGIHSYGFIGTIVTIVKGNFEGKPPAIGRLGTSRRAPPSLAGRCHRHLLLIT